MKSVSSQFDENANSQEALIQKNQTMQKQYDLQQQKIKLLNDQLEKQTRYLSEQRNEIQRLTEEFGENSKEVQKAKNAYASTETSISKLKTSINETTSYSNKLSNDINKNNKMLDEMASGSRDAATGLEKVGDSANNVESDINDLSNSADELNQNFKEAFSADAIADFASGMIDNMKGIVEESKEYIKIMGSLETSSKNLNYTTEETTQTYNLLYGVLGDTQTAATTTANLQAIGLEQEDLIRITKGAIGAWATYGDSIPIDSLAESINETIRVGQVTGTFADMLNWAGTSEDAFNEKLANCSSESERANLILQEMANQGLIGAADAWNANNKNLVDANLAQEEYNKTMAELSNTLMPLFTTVMQIVTEIIKLFTQLPEPIQLGVVAILGIITVLSSLAPIITAIGMASGGAAAGTGALSASLLPIAAIVLGIVAAITALILVIQNWGAITDWIHQKWIELQQWASNLWNGMKSSWDNGIENVKNKLDEWAQGVGEDFSDALNSIDKWISDTISSFINWGSDLINTGKQSVSEFVSNIVNGIGSLPGKFWSWGCDMIDNFIGGIKQKLSGLKNTFNSITGWIRSVFHFSVPDQGPLADADTWMPDFMDLIAKGIHDNRNKVQKEVMELANMMNLEPSYTSSSRTITNPTVVVNTTTTLDGRIISKNTEKHVGNRQDNLAFMKG